MALKFFKYIVQAVAIESDELGNIVGEKTSDPKVIYNDEQMMEFMQEVKQTLGGSQNGLGDERAVGDNLRQSILSRERP